MLSPEPSNVLRSGAKAFSPANGDPRFSRTTPDAHLARIEEAEAADAIGSTKVWAGRILRDRIRKAPVYSDGRKQMLQQMQGRAVAAEQAAAKRQKTAAPSTFQLAPAAGGSRYPQSAITLGGDADSPLVPIAFDGAAWSSRDLPCRPCRFS